MANKVRIKVDEVWFSYNGNTAAFSGEEQVLELQESWLRLYVKFLRSKGVDPEKVTFYLPGGRTTARWEGNNWRVE